MWQWEGGVFSLKEPQGPFGWTLPCRSLTLEGAYPEKSLESELDGAGATYPSLLR